MIRELAHALVEAPEVMCQGWECVRCGRDEAGAGGGSSGRTSVCCAHGLQSVLWTAGLSCMLAWERLRRETSELLQFTGDS